MLPTLPRQFFGIAPEKVRKARPSFRVLLIEDEEMLRIRMGFMLQARPRYTLAGEASNSAETLNQLRDLTPHVAILSIHLKDGGVELIQRMLAARPTTKILVHAKQDMAENSLRAQQAGAMGCVRSTAPSAAFVAALDAVASGQRHFYKPWPVVGLRPNA